MPRANWDFIGNLLTCIPPKGEQQRISSFLNQETEKLDALIEKKRRLIELLREKRIALISHAVTRGLDPKIRLKDSGGEWLGKIPNHWNTRRFKLLLRWPLQYGANESAEFEDQSCPRYIRITDIDDEGNLRPETFKSLPEDVAKPYILKDGDLLFARSGATVGKTFLYRNDWGRSAFAGYLIRARLDRRLALPSFYSYYTQSSHYWDWLQAIFIQATIQNVSAEKYGNLMVTLPPIDEQKQIVNFLNMGTKKLDRLSKSVEDAIVKLQEYRAALITAVVTGKIDVRNG